jgi:hypothetical protein
MLKGIPMSDNGIKKAKDQVVRMDDFVMDGLFSLSDEELLQEALEDGVDLAAVGDAGRKSFERAQLIVGKKRLALVRQEMEMDAKKPALKPIRGTSQADLEGILSRNREAASKLTMAARNELGDMQDDSEGILADFIELGAIPGDGEEDV